MLPEKRIRQIEAKALRKLRHPSRSKKLKDFLDQYKRKWGLDYASDIGSGLRC